ncbi:MAG TPA: alpha/beta hydrolase [Candidatus Dormibacteraeota bacterium]
MPLVQAPSFGIWSEGDLYLTEDSMVASRDRVAGEWRYERFEGSHWIPIDQPDRLNRVLLEFLSKGR